MKTSKSPRENEVTPSKKKLTQARLPFKIISEVSPKTVTPTRKRKLSTPDTESTPKVGKISKENGISEDPVIIIDDDSKDGRISDKVEKLPNPYVRLVDTAIKKKLQKSKGSKKKKSKQVKVNDSLDTDSDKVNDASEVMEVDEPSEQTIAMNGANSSKITILSETDNNVNKSSVKTSDNDSIILKNSKEIVDTEVTLSHDIEEEKNLDIKQDENKLADLSTADVEMVQNGHKESPPPSDTENNQVIDTEELKIPATPKRSMRNRPKKEENNNANGSPSSLKLNESVSSSPRTPKQGSSIKSDESLNGTPSNNLTPKQLQKKLESAKKREEREKEKQDREKKRLQEKEERAKLKQEKEDQRKKEREEKEEAKKKEKEEKEELRKKEKEEKEKLKEQEKKQREEKEEQKRKEKEEKEEQKRKEKEAREEERRKKQEALELEKQEQELKKKKTAEAFVSFFVPKQKTEKDQPTVGTVGNNMLTNFTLKSDMRLAPTTRTSLSEQKAEDLVKLIKEQSVKEDGLYLKSLKTGDSKPLSSGKTWPRGDKDDDDVILVEDELPLDGAGEILTLEPATREKLRPKLLSFHENRRPPYWGTWRKTSDHVRPRRPFGQDEKQLDYSVDSDDEWEEEEGESVGGSAAPSDDEGPDEYELDNELFVPHGYLSDEEATMDEDDVLSLSPETQKAKLKHLEDEFESEMKKPTEKLKPRLYGVLWENSEGGKPEKCVDALWNYFGKFAMILNDPTPLLQPSQEPEDAEKKKVKKKKPAPTTDETGQKVEKKKKIQDKESKPPEKKPVQEAKKNQPGINMFLTKRKTT